MLQVICLQWTRRAVTSYQRRVLIGRVGSTCAVYRREFRKLEEGSLWVQQRSSVPECSRRTPPSGCQQLAGVPGHRLPLQPGISRLQTEPRPRPAGVAAQTSRSRGPDQPEFFKEELTSDQVSPTRAGSGQCCNSSYAFLSVSSRHFGTCTGARSCYGTHLGPIYFPSTERIFKNCWMQL